MCYKKKLLKIKMYSNSDDMLTDIDPSKPSPAF